MKSFGVKKIRSCLPLSESMIGVSRKEASGGRHKGEIGFSNHRQDKIVNDGHIVSCYMVFEAGLVFMQSHIARIMKAVFDPPIGAQHVQQLEQEAAPQTSWSRHR